MQPIETWGWREFLIVKSIYVDYIPFSLIFFMFLFGLISVAIRRRKLKLTAIAEKFNLHMSGCSFFVRTVTMSGVYQGTVVQFQFDPGGKHTKPQFIARINCSSSYTVTLQPHTASTGLMESLRKSKDVLIFDDIIDRMFEISVEPESPSSEFLKKMDVRQLLLTLDNDLSTLTHLIIETGFIEYSRKHSVDELSEGLVRGQVDFMVQLMRLAGGEAPEPIPRTDEPQ
jgi:hypothetical protein